MATNDKTNDEFNLSIDIRTYTSDGKNASDYNSYIQQLKTYIKQNALMDDLHTHNSLVIDGPFTKNVSEKPMLIKSIKDTKINSRPIFNIDSHISYQNIYNHYSNFDETSNLDEVVVNVGYFDEAKGHYYTFNANVKQPNKQIVQARNEFEQQKSEFFKKKMQK